MIYFWILFLSVYWKLLINCIFYLTFPYINTCLFLLPIIENVSTFKKTLLAVEFALNFDISSNYVEMRFQIISLYQPTSCEYIIFAHTIGKLLEYKCNSGRLMPVNNNLYFLESLLLNAKRHRSIVNPRSVITLCEKKMETLCNACN